MPTGFSTNIPYLFTVSFDVPDPETSALDEAEAAEQQLPTYSLEDVNSAREEGRRKGHEAGISEAGRGIENALETTMETLAAHFQALTAEQQKANAEIERQGIGAAIAIVRKLFPSLVQEHGFSEIEAVMRQCLSQFIHEPRVTVHVPTELLEIAQESLQAMLESVAFTGQLEVLGDDNLGAGDCRVEWANGEARRESERVLAEIGETIDQTLSHAAELAAAAAQAPVAEDELPEDGPAEESTDVPSEDHSPQPAANGETADGETQTDEATMDVEGENGAMAADDLPEEPAAELNAELDPQLQDSELPADQTAIEEQTASADAAEHTDTARNQADTFEEQTDVQAADRDRPND